MGTGAPNASCRRSCTFTSSSECPPRSKNPSWAPMLSIPSTSPHTAATFRSASVRGGTGADADGRAPSGAGRAPRSTLPVELRGNASSTHHAAGTMYSGSRSRSHARRTAGSGACPSRGTT
jgi:hypothetical protein